MKKLIATIVLFLAGGSSASAAILPLPAIGSGTIYARYNGENVVTSGSDVTTWQNIQPSSFQTTLNATAHTNMGGGFTPTLPNVTSNVSEINGLPYLHFVRASDTSGDTLRTGTLSVGDQSPNSDKFTIFHVGRINALGGQDPEMYDGVDGSHRKALLIESVASPANSMTLFTSTSGNSPLAAPVDGQFHIFATVFNGSNSELWMDGNLISSTLNPGTQSAWAGLTIGARHTDVIGKGFFANMDMAELMAIRGNLSSTDFGTIGSYLEFKYGLDTAFANVDFTAIPAPEPSSMMLLGLGCVGLMARRRRR
jgi:hypothetical protein